MKIITRTVLLLAIINIALLYMHYSQLADASEDRQQNSKYSQEIEVINRADKMIVRHHFRNLNVGRHEIVLPIGSKEPTCYLENELSCTRLNENSTAFLEGEGDTQSISYTISKESALGSRKLFKAPFASLRNESPTSTILHITDETNNRGMWISGLQLVGSKEMDMIEYSLFKGKGQVTDLYWQRNAQPLTYSSDHLSIYGEATDAVFVKEMTDNLERLKTDHIDMVFDGTNKALESDRFMITTGNQSSVYISAVRKAIRTHYKIPSDELITADLVTSILVGKKAGGKKSNAAYAELMAVLTPSQTVALTTTLEDKRGSKVDAATLDEVIGSIIGKGTSFVRKNKESVYPLLFEESRAVVVGGETVEELNIIIKDDRTLYPINKVLTRLGYEVSANNRSIYIENDMDKLRFSLRDPFYVLNEKRYTLRESPFERIGDDYYFEEDALRRIFQLSIQKSDDTITVTSLKKGSSE